MTDKKPTKKRILNKPKPRRICFETIEDAKPFLEKLLNGEEVLAGKVVYVVKEEISAQMVSFVKEYIKDYNGTQAALRAGYSLKNATSNSHLILAKKGVTAMVEIEAKKFALKHDLSNERIAEEWRRLSFWTVMDFMKWVDGMLVVKNSEELTPEQAAAIKEVYTDRDGNIRFKFHEKTKALEDLAKSRKIIDYEKKTEIANADDKPFALAIEETASYEEAAQMFLEKTVKGKE